MTEASHAPASRSESRRVVPSVLAHPGAAEILCAGTLIRLIQEYGYDVHVATATAGDRGTADLPESDAKLP